MFDETEKYPNQGHFFFKKGNNSLKDVSKDVPNLPGVYYIVRLARGRVDLVYIGQSGTINQKGVFKKPFLKDGINIQQDGSPRQAFFDNKMTTENIDGLDIYWFVTVDEHNNDLPSYVEALLMQRYYEVNGDLPIWNVEF